MGHIWTFKHEPNKFEDMILDEKLKPILKKVLKDVPNLLLYGSAGVGKGTFTNILLKHTGYDSMWLNASDETGIDAIREKVRTFSTAMSVTPMKIVVLNEADSLTSGPQGSQKILRQLMEDVQGICRFVFLANYINNIIPELQSRCLMVKVDNPPAKDIFRFACSILNKEKVKYDKKAVLNIVKKCYPDIRSTVLTLQNNSIDGELQSDFVTSSEPIYEEILKMMLSQDIEGVRKSLRSNYINYPDLYKFLYDNAGEFSSPGGAILSIGEHLKNDGFVAIKEINFMHMVVEMMFNKVIK